MIISIKLIRKSIYGENMKAWRDDDWIIPLRLINVEHVAFCDWLRASICYHEGNLFNSGLCFKDCAMKSGQNCFVLLAGAFVISFQGRIMLLLLLCKRCLR